MYCSKKIILLLFFFCSAQAFFAQSCDNVGFEFGFYIPNAFTPTSDDGKNDTFFGKGTGIKEYHLWIFDRWGNMVFYTEDIGTGWNAGT